MKDLKSYHASCLQYDRYIYASGDYYKKKYAKKVERYDILLDVWEEMPNLNFGRCHHASYSVGDSVYVFCGEFF